MSVAITTSEASFAGLGLGGIVFPVSTGLTDLFYFGVDAAQTQRNYAPGGSAAALVGSPVYNANSAVFNGNTAGAAYLTLSHPMAQAFTVIEVARELDGTNDSYFYSDSVGNGNFAYAGTAGANQFRMGSGGVALDLALLLNQDQASFGFHAFRHTGSVMTAFQGKSGSLIANSAAQTRAAASSTNVRVGASSTLNAGTGDRTIELAMLAVFNIALTDAEVIFAYEKLIEILARKGISGI